MVRLVRRVPAAMARKRPGLQASNALMTVTTPEPADWENESTVKLLLGHVFGPTMVAVMVLGTSWAWAKPTTSATARVRRAASLRTERFGNIFPPSLTGRCPYDRARIPRKNKSGDKPIRGNIGQSRFHDA